MASYFFTEVFPSSFRIRSTSFMRSSPVLSASTSATVCFFRWMSGSPYADMEGIICDGSIRSGKTTVMSLSFVMWAMERH